MTVSFPRARWVALASIVAIAFLSGGWLLRPRPAAGGGVYQQARLFENVVGAINRHYIDSLDEGDLYQRAAEALVTSLKDPYAELLIKESYREYQRQMTGTAVEFDLQRATESGFDSEHGAGIGHDDEVLSIDGTSTEGWPAERVEKALRTAAGPTLTVVVRPRGSEHPVVRRITRTSVHVPATSAGVLLKGGVGYAPTRTPLGGPVAGEYAGGRSSGLSPTFPSKPSAAGHVSSAAVRGHFSIARGTRLLGEAGAGPARTPRVRAGADRCLCAAVTRLR